MQPRHALIPGGEVDDRGQDGADDHPGELVPIEEWHADKDRLSPVVEWRPQHRDELDNEEQVPPAPSTPPFALLIGPLIHRSCPKSFLKSFPTSFPRYFPICRMLSSAGFGAGDGNRTHDTQLGKLLVA